jgi:hypothetical protein
VRHADGVYELNLAALEQAFAAGARAYLLCSPHNPVGPVWTRAELEAVAAVAEATSDVLVEELGQPTPPLALNLSPKEIVRRYLFGLFEYERVNLVLCVLS